MDFSSALMIIKSRRFVARQGWPEKDAKLGPIKSEENSQIVNIKAFKDGDPVAEWRPTMEDILATDWYLVK